MSKVLKFSAVDSCAPLNLIELKDDDLQTLPISTIKLDDGTYKVISEYGDDVWVISPERFPTNKYSSDRKMNFNTLPNQFVDAAKYALKHYDINDNPRGSTLVSKFHVIRPFLNYLDRVDVKSTRNITPMLCSNYVHEVNHAASKTRNKPLTEGTKTHRFEAVETLYRHLKGTVWAFEHPWVESSACALAGQITSGKKTAKTDIIPDEDLQSLVQYCNALIDKAPRLLAMRDRIDQLRHQYATHSTPSLKLNEELDGFGYEAGLQAFNAELYHLSIATGVITLTFSGTRNHEFAAIQTDAYRIQDEEDDIYYWLKSHSDKTYEGYTEWLVPEIVVKAVDVQKAVVEPLRQALLAEQQERLANDPTDERGIEINGFKDHLFLTKDQSNGNQINPLSGKTFNRQLKGVCQHIGIKAISSHQFRRTFAVYVAGSQYGDLRYLKRHFKHWSMDMTLLYAFNEQQDEELFDEIAYALRNHKIEVITDWLSEETILTGGVGNRVMAYRSSGEKIRTYESRRKMAETISDTIHLRPTGHSWCTADTGSCGGRSAIEGARCPGCEHSVIERKRHGTWYEDTHKQQLELSQINDMGPAGQQRIERDIEQYEQVLKDLGMLNELQESIDE